VFILLGQNFTTYYWQY